MNIAFLYIAEAYQCYHSAAVAIELASRPGVRVTSYYNDPVTPHHLERIRLAYGAPPMEYRRLARAPWTRLLQAIRILGMFKPLVMRDNAAELNGYDVIIASENSAAVARKLGIDRPKLIFSPHGFGDRVTGFLHRIAVFDYVLIAGSKTADRMLELELIKPESHALVGMIKLETGDALQKSHGSFFSNDRPTVLYNPHKAPDLESWSRFINPMLEAFAASDDFNLIVAPHIKMFRRRSQRVRDHWEARSTANVLIDTSSDRLLDLSYTTAADIYIGDISSQVYEFLVQPRPCIFLNAHKIDWKEDPSFRNWHLGDVIDDPADLMPAIRSAQARHHLYVKKQEELASASIGDRSPGASKRAADAVMAFLSR